MAFTPQIDEIIFTLCDCAGLRDYITAENTPTTFNELSLDLIEAVLTEAGKFSSEQISPLNQTGDKVGCQFQNGDVSTPPGWGQLYKNWSEGGWNALASPPEYGGQGLPLSLNFAAQELWNTGSLAFATGTVLTAGAIEALESHASNDLKEKYLPNLISGKWMGTMNLTEPQAGTDLGLIKTKAIPQDDGTYSITGTKIFISYGEHDLTDNIIHLVLARLPGAEEGTKGISLFVVPKFIVNEDGTLGERNDVMCAGLEHKLGIHGSPTCMMSFGEKGGAQGWLIGEEGLGLKAMFTMMNNARLSVGIQGVAIAEYATQKAFQYAKERKQGRKPGDEETLTIIKHPDVQVMLLLMKAHTMISRALCASTAVALDLSSDKGLPEFKRYKMTADFLTPLAKAYSTDIGFEVASHGVQVHGGMGYIEETGAAQCLRDARILSIYEGTNGIQAIDFITRKLPMDEGGFSEDYIHFFQALCDKGQKSGNSQLVLIGKKLAAALLDLSSASKDMLTLLRDNQDKALYHATDFARSFASIIGAAMIFRGLMAHHEDQEIRSPQYVSYMKVLNFYIAKMLPVSLSLLSNIRTRDDDLDIWQQDPLA